MRGLLGWTLSLTVAAPALAHDDRLAVDEILRRTIEAQEKHEDSGNEVKYDYELVSKIETLDRNGEVEKVENELYRSHHIEGLAYERLVEKNGHELTKKEREKEAKRERQFRDKIRDGKAKHNDADDRVEFNEELLARYDIELVGAQPLSGQECYVLAFQPKPGKLPERRTVDRALNKAEGQIWVDRKTFEIARIEFELREKISLWWGMMGSVSRMRGQFQRQPMDDGIWLPARFDFYMKARMLFRSIHIRQALAWTDFEKRAEAVASDR